MTGAGGGVRVLGLVTEAYGGAGGIAQYNRDFWGALADTPGIGPIDLLARSGGHGADGVPGGLRLRRMRRGRAAYAASALRLALWRRPHVVVCGHLFMVTLAALAARLCGARLVVQLHGIEIWREPGGLRRRALERANLVLCVSRDTRARLLAAADLPPERAVVLPNTVAEDYEPGRPRAPRAGPRVILSVGRLDAREAYKGQDAVIACLTRLRQAGHDVLYRIIGDGDDRPRLERLARDLGVADRVRFLGALGRAAMPDAYRDADLFVLPSRGEGFGIVFLEAMACGTPALGLACGGAVDALDGLGLAVRAEDLAEAIGAALDRSAAGRGAAEAGDLAGRVRGRFGRAHFERGVAQALERLGIDPQAGPCPALRLRPGPVGAPA